MSWAEEDWTVGLSGRVLQKVKELQVLKDRLSRENKQKQLQLDNTHTSLEKQTAKYEEVRGELHFVQRELQSVREDAKAAVTSKERLTQELHTKQAQVCSLEGQLDAARNHNNQLSQEIKRLEAELEKLQNSSRLSDTALFSTPCWSASSPWEHNGSRQEERSGQRDEGQRHHIRQRLQFSDTGTSSLPRQQTSTPLRHPSEQSDIFSTPSAVFPWERDDNRPASRRRPVSSPQIPSPEVVAQGLVERSFEQKVHKTETGVSSSELQSRILALEDRLSEKVGKLKSIQSEMGLMKKELAAKELSLQKTQDELNAAQTRGIQDKERVLEAEHKLKQLQEELKCQRQNAESSRLQHQQRTKELEKVHQRDLAELQKERQCLEKQHQQEVNKLNQELQQARTLHNALQAQADKLSLQKQALDKELDALKQKLKWTEEQLKESQKKEAQTQAKLTEAVREAEGVAVTLEQSRKRERALEEEGRRLQEEQADTLRLLKELQEQKASAASAPQPAHFGAIGQSFSSQSSYAQSSRATAQSRRPAASQSEQNRDGSRAEITVAYPSGREPGEGIDAEQITFNIANSEGLQKPGQRGEGDREVENRSNIPLSTSADFDRAKEVESSPVAECLISSKSKQCPDSDQRVSSVDLKRENDLLRSDLRDVREELQKRLEDLEAQRRAETEAKTRLKQLSRKHSNLAAERDEKEKDLKAKLENEKAETERLKRTVAALEAEMKRSRENMEKEKQEEEEKPTQNDREIELIELNIQLKNQLSMVKAQLALEREEREREEEERNQMINTDADVNTELSLKLAEIMVDVEELKHRREEDSTEDGKLSTASSPLPSLHDYELSSNTICSTDSLLSSPEEHLLFCETTNQRNTLLSTESAHILHLSEEATQDTSDRTKMCPSAHQGDQTQVVEALQKKCIKESERAKKFKDKFEALQIQVTRQTKELTTAFEKQSLHIVGLLAELQEKESTLLRQGEELIQCKQELSVLKEQENKAVKQTLLTEEGEKDEKFTGKLEEQEEAPTPVPPSDFKVQTDEVQPNSDECDAQMAPPVGSKEESAAVTSGTQPQTSPDMGRLCGSVCEVEQDPSSQQGEKVEVFTELFALRQENKLLQQRIQDLANMHTRDQTSQTDGENRNQTEHPGPASCLAGQDVLEVIKEAAPDKLLEMDVKKTDDEAQDLERHEKSSMSEERNPEEMSNIQIKHLQEQLEVLQRRVRTLTEETQTQAQELTLWRLSSQPASAVQQQLTNTDDEDLSQIPVSGRSQSAQSLVQKNQDVLTIIREDDLSLCCSSNKLQGRMLFSRLQNGSLPEPKSIRSSKKAPQGYTQNTSKFDQESEKENQEINLQQPESCPEQNKLSKDAEIIQLSPQKISQNHAAKDLPSFSGSSSTKVENCYMGAKEAMLNCGTDKTGTSTNSDNNDVRVEVVSVGSQTENSLLSKASAATQTEEDLDAEEKSVESPPASSVCSAEKAETGDKMLLSSSFPIPADPARLAERIRRNRTQLSAAFDDTEYEPYGLPEVVMKGFADIPSGPSCPYIVRRGLLGTVQPLSEKERQEDEETD
ncbi:centromere protein F isoform X1 [Cyprinodon tularosa]|uniref:centromere protein F isoform X1 n=1 Tax=Cyprinodon tularosa TaxID=77115 RepID=UPI0018E232CA|nr:centromere protein F isoform X1 [Cyprinodon tularosa]